MNAWDDAVVVHLKQSEDGKHAPAEAAAWDPGHAADPGPLHEEGEPSFWEDAHPPARPVTCALQYNDQEYTYEWAHLAQSQYEELWLAAHRGHAKLAATAGAPTTAGR